MDTFVLFFFAPTESEINRRTHLTDLSAKCAAYVEVVHVAQDGIQKKTLCFTFFTIKVKESHGNASITVIIVLYVTLYHVL